MFQIGHSHWTIGVEGQLCAFELEGRDLVDDGHVNGVDLLGHDRQDVHLDSIELVEARLSIRMHN